MVTSEKNIGSKPLVNALQKILNMEEITTEHVSKIEDEMDVE